MRNGFMAAIAVGCALAGTQAALAAPNCGDFFSNSDGSWSPTHIIMVEAPTSQTQIGPSDRLLAGTPGLSGRLGRYLDVHCRLGGSTVVHSLAIPKNP
jgi:hypothetical protein